jgi:hypothetical protein
MTVTIARLGSRDFNGGITVTNAVETSNKIVLAKPSRREVAAMGAVAAMWSASAGAKTLNAGAAPASDGPLPVKVEGNVFHPVVGVHPGVVMFAHVGASDAANAAVAEQLASQGWSVMLVSSKLTTDYEAMRAEARKHVEQLLSLASVAAPAKTAGSANGYVLRNITAAQPQLSLATRSQRQKAASSAVLFSIPAAVAATDKRRMESLSAVARALHSRAA